MKKITTIICLVCLLPAASCLRNGADGEKGGAPTLGVTLYLDRMGSESATRVSVAPEEGEENVGTLHLYFFEASDDQSGRFVACIEVEEPLGMNRQYRVPTADTHIDVTTAYNIVAIANIADNQYIPGPVDEWNAMWNGRTEAYFRTQAAIEIAQASGQSDNSKAIAPDRIPMHGITSKKAMDGDISLTLTRNVARFDVINNAGDYDLLSVSIWNGYARSSVTGDGILDYSTAYGLRTERFYGVNNAVDQQSGEYPLQIRGGLYAFENKVVAPAQNDNHTTCLIIGLKARSGGDVGYYRVNVHPEGSPQNLRRNNVYRVTITGVAGSGAQFESDAYAGTKTELEYDINLWDLDDNGMVISDRHSVLVVPVKTIRFGAEGGVENCAITALSTLPSPSPLIIRSQIYDPSTDGINASLTGETLTVNVSQLGEGEEERTGMITLNYAGLEASIAIVQSRSIDKYLNVKLDDSWVSILGSMAGLSSEPIYVASSGPWTAELFGEGFSFDTTAGDGGPTTLLKSESLPSANQRFRINTHVQNETGEMRKAFVLISLNDDPINHVAVVTIYQKPVGAVNIVPDADMITFDALGNMTSHPVNTVFKVSGTAENETLNCRLEGDDDDRFTVVLKTSTTPAELTVKAETLNTSGKTYTATLVITGEDDNELKRIAVRQASATLSMTPSVFATIPVGGDTSELISLSTGDESSQWTAEVTIATNTAGRTLVNHMVHFEDKAGNRLDVSQPQSVGTKFKVVFPKVYYPNRDMDISATVTVKIVNSELTRTFTIPQNGLYARDVNIWNSQTGYGTLATGSTFFKSYSNALAGLGYRWIEIKDNNGGMTPPANINYIHVGNQYMPASFIWSEIEKFRTDKDGILLIVAEENNSVQLSAVNSPTSPFSKNCYIVEAPDQLKGHGVFSSTETRIVQFLTTHGVTKLDPNPGSFPFFINNVRTELAEWPDSAVPVIVHNDNEDRVIMAIDPVNKLVYLGEGQIFDQNNELNADPRAFTYNFIEYVKNTAKYGSHFTDLLREDLAGEIPPPWGDEWGVNKWPY